MQRKLTLVSISYILVVTFCVTGLIMSVGSVQASSIENWSSSFRSDLTFQFLFGAIIFVTVAFALAIIALIMLNKKKLHTSSSSPS